MKLARTIAIRAAIYGMIWFALCAVIGIFAVEGALHPPRLPLDSHDETSAQAVAARNHATLGDIAIQAADSVTLRAWSFTPAQASGGVVLLLHGQADNRTSMLGTADLLLRHGYAVVLPDARAHGQSGGQIATYGALETSDIRLWAGWIEHTQSPRCLDGLGDSMGAAQILEATVQIPEFCAVVAESPFASFREAAYDRIGQEFRTGPWVGRTLLWPAIEEGLLYTRMRYSVDLTQNSPRRAVASTQVPVLLIHGLADTNLPPRHSELIRTANQAVALWEPTHAGHCGAADAEPAEYERRVIGWFDSHSSHTALTVK